MRLKAPLPRMRSLASRTPCVLVDRLPYKKAKWLVSVVEELGGDARMEVITDRPRPQPAPQREAAPEPDRVEIRREAPPQRERPRRVSPGAVVCPSCGWEEDAHAKFCSMCRHSFNKTDRIDLATLRQPGFSDPSENPLQSGEQGRRHRADRGTRRGVPAGVIIGAGLALLLVPLIILIVNLTR